MQIQFTPEEEAQLAKVAAKSGVPTERLVKDAALNLLSADERFRAAVEEALAQAERGEFVEESEMEARINRMLQS